MKEKWEKDYERLRNAWCNMNTKCFKKLINLAEYINEYQESLEQKAISKPRASDFTNLEFGGERTMELLTYLSVQDFPDEIIKELAITKRQIQDYLTTLRTILYILAAT